MSARLLVVSPTVSHDEEFKAKRYTDDLAIGRTISESSNIEDPRAKLLMALWENMNKNKISYGINVVIGTIKDPKLYGGDGVFVTVNSTVSNAEFSKIISDAFAGLAEDLVSLTSNYVVQDIKSNLRYINGEKSKSLVGIEATVDQPSKSEQIGKVRLGKFILRPPGE